jgi:excisionase family DNA binding protein
MNTNDISFDNLPLTMRVEDLMPILGIGRNTAYDLVHSGKIFSIRIGRQLRIPREALIAFLRGQEFKFR